MGSGGHAFVWKPWDACVIPHPSNASAPKPVYLEECGAALLRAAAAYSQIGRSFCVNHKYMLSLTDRHQINTMPTDANPSGYIVSDANDLLGLFDADFGVLVIGEGAKILGPNQHGQEILVVAEYLRMKQFK